jgi:YD repeat-containing protein
VTKPGFPNPTVPKQFFTYTAIGLPQTAEDAEQRVTSYAYDPTHADAVTSVTLDSGAGHLNLTTAYTYDAYGNVHTITDANQNTTTEVAWKIRTGG